MTFAHLTDAQWSLVAPLVELESTPDRYVQQPKYGRRATLDGVLWVILTGSPWRSLPPSYPSIPACQHTCASWCDTGVMQQIADALKEPFPELGLSVFARRRQRRTERRNTKG
ncbi:transposase [Paraburkholderia ultramafica]